jgi:hypothetical protein
MDIQRGHLECGVYGECCSGENAIAKPDLTFS